jgi:gamma-glutamyltranspeptidase / glutathione hydrolase / leukotriene-C4 hydrolase
MKRKHLSTFVSTSLHLAAIFTHFCLIYDKKTFHIIYSCFEIFINTKKTRKNVIYMIFIGLFVYLAFGICEFIGERPIYYKEFAVSSELPEASRIGLEILKRGGNSVDAAIGTCIAVGIVNAFSSGLGGGGFVLIKKKGDNEFAYMLDFREKSSGNFKLEDYLLDRSKSMVGGLAVGIPGELKGLHRMHSELGRLPWKALFTECIELCKGFKVTKELEKRFIKFEKEILADPGLSEVYSRDGKILREGDTVVRYNYMRTLIKLSTHPEDFYTGDIAKSLIKIINFNGGNVTANDFKNVEPIKRKVLKDVYKGYNIFTTNLPSSGVLIIEALKVFEKYDLQKIYEKSLKTGSYEHIHILVEILKFVMARRGELGDPKFLPDYENIIRGLVDDKNISNIYNKLNRNRTLDIENYKPTEHNVTDHGTTHINVVDKNGLVVSLTSTINLEWGAKLMDPDTGIILNNQIDDFYFPKISDKEEDYKNVPNLGAPNKIPLSSAAPMILEKDNEILVLGAAGGIRIPTSLIEVIFWLSLGSTLDEAIRKPRLHHQLDPNILYVEFSEDKNVIEYLKSIGHHVETSKTNSVFTSVQGIFDKVDNNIRKIFAVSDKRKGGKPAGG